MHYASIAFLWRHWDVVIVSTQSMLRVCIESGVVARTTREEAGLWSHYAWRQRLLNSAAKRPGERWVLPTDEGYTTRTCGLCGTLNHHVGRSKVFECADRTGCGVWIDRDVNGARNIALRLYTRRRMVEEGRG